MFFNVCVKYFQHTDKIIIFLQLLDENAHLIRVSLDNHRTYTFTLTLFIIPSRVANKSN